MSKILHYEVKEEKCGAIEVRKRERGGESERGNERGRTRRSEKEHFIGHLLIVRSVNKKTNSLIAFMKVQQKKPVTEKSPQNHFWLSLKTNDASATKKATTVPRSNCS